jgi:multiple sugar transport system substrate-binding protein
MLKHLSRRRFLQSSAIIAASAGVAAPQIARAEGTEIKALLITGGPLYPKYWEQIAQDFKKKTGITVNYDLLEFTPLTSKTVTLGAAQRPL